MVYGMKRLIGKEYGVSKERNSIFCNDTSFTCHINFTQGSHVVEVDIINNTAPDACYIIHSSIFHFSFNSHPTPFNLNEFQQRDRNDPNYYVQLIIFTLTDPVTDPFKKPCVFLYLNHKNIFFSKRRGIHRYHFLMRDSFHDRDERNLL